MEEKDKDGLKIMNQFRAKGGMTYDLKCKGTRITLLVAPRSNADDRGDWRVEARSSRPQEDAVVVTEWGPTRIEALRAVGRSWTSTAPNLGMFDWEAVAAVLNSVRAL
jgi:hypothetical protein